MIRRSECGSQTLGLLLASVLVVGCSSSDAQPDVEQSAGAVEAPADAYALDQHRTAEWFGIRDDVLTAEQVDDLARNVDYLVITKFSAGFDLDEQFAQAAAVDQAATELGREVRVLPYLSAAFWFEENEAWGPYAADFDPAWLLEDSTGTPITFTGTDSNGTMIDLRDERYRRWAVRLVKDWMAVAPLSGVALDSANELLGPAVRRNIGDGTSSYNDLLCGPGAQVDAEGACQGVRDWNQGLVSLVSELKAAIGPGGGEVLYNGIAPSPLRGEGRNLGLLEVADGATNESFCYTATDAGLTFNSVSEDADLMREIAEQDKVALEVTNHRIPEAEPYGEYCLAAFLVGWQPGSSYWTYHAGYEGTRDTSGLGNEIPEQRLALGAPTTSGYTDDGSVLSRDFDSGTVVVNDSDTRASFVAPADVSRYFGGQVVASYEEGDTISLEPRSGAVLVRD